MQAGHVRVPRRGLALALMALLALLLTSSVQAQSAIEVVGEPKEENQFPDGIVFSIQLQSAVQIEEVRFRYTFLPENRSSVGTAEFQKGPRVQASFTLRSGGQQRYMPPGKDIRYSWEIRDAAGNELTVPARETTFADPRFPWKSVVDGLITVNYYEGVERDAEVMALVARETVEKAAQVMGTQFDFTIKIWAYANRRDFQIALAHESVSSDPGVLGQAHEPDTFIMVIDRLSSPSALDTARHELTHLVTARALADGAFSSLFPSWLNEGTSVYFQVSPNDVGYIDELDKAIRSDRVIPLRQLTSGTRARNVGLFYGQGYSVVKFLIDKHGEANFARMIDAFNRSGSIDEAFTTTYGADQDTIYRQWRESVGLSAQAAAAPAPAPDAAQATSGDGGDNTTLLVAVGMGALILLLLAAVAGGVLLARRAGVSGG